MAQSINLIPREEKTEQLKVKVVKSSTMLTIVILMIVIGISVYYVYKKTTLENEIKQHEENITDLRAQITDLSEVEIVSRNLDKKYQALKIALTGRVHYSDLLAELSKRLPPNVVIDDLNLGKNNTLNISGHGENYISISNYISNMTEPYPEIATEGLDKLFTGVALNSVTLDNKTTGAEFFIVPTYDPEVLKR